ncbi:unnamed protein product [Rotaria magnacalcarata]|uniref:Uncharacterized protein n=1 Tax=Rotaria magnacalcarata TaxID=392030 RepID=A0A816XMF4_9BILA|nr:unnamed protein product [Rotaria magnacalcarata]
MPVITCPGRGVRPGNDDESGSESNDEESDDCGSDGNKRLQANEVDDSAYQTSLNSPAEEEFMRLPCFSHSLQLVVNDGIKASGTALSCLKKVANDGIKASGTALSCLKKVAELTRLAHCSTPFAERLEKSIIECRELTELGGTVNSKQ